MLRLRLNSSGRFQAPYLPQRWKENHVQGIPGQARYRPGSSQEGKEMRIFGFKRRRLDEWRAVLKEELVHNTVWRLAWEIFKAIVTGRFPGRKEWRRRMRTCPKCPIYDPVFKRCRAVTEKSVFGCGCYVAFMALCKRHGWATENLPADQAKEICW